MTREQKDLLLKDLCARLPYGVEVEYNNINCELLSIDMYNEELTIWICTGYSTVVKLEDVKPYLLPLSSMTEEQRKEYEGIIYKYIELHCERYYDVIDIDDFENLEDFFKENHLDYRGLIRMELANDATGKNIY